LYEVGCIGTDFAIVHDFKHSRLGRCIFRVLEVEHTQIKLSDTQATFSDAEKPKMNEDTISYTSTDLAPTVLTV
jgi:hypothetical protein